MSCLHPRLSLLFILLFIILFGSSSPSAASILEGTVVKVADGDTITVLDSNKEQHRIRLAGIDAPEKRQPFGNASMIPCTPPLKKRGHTHQGCGPQIIPW